MVVDVAKSKPRKVCFFIYVYTKLNTLSIQEIYQLFLEGIKKTSALEYIAVFTGIASVWFSRIENILVYPVGLINTIIYIYLSFKFHLLGEATVNFYYTVMSIYGWILWAKRDERHEHVMHITSSSARDWRNQLLFFTFFYIGFYIGRSSHPCLLCRSLM